jgi:hypothetical protein
MREGGVSAIQMTRALEAVLRGWAKAYRNTPEHRFPSDPHAEFFPVDLEAAADEIERLANALYRISDARMPGEARRIAVETLRYDGGKVEYTESEKGLIRAQLREGNRLAREVVIQRGVKAHPRIAAIKALATKPEKQP